MVPRDRTAISGIRFRRTRTSSLIAGAMSGAMGTSSGIGAPLLALLYQQEAGPRIRATLAVLYTGASILILIVLIGFGQFAVADARSGAFLMPGLLVGYWIASRFTLQVDRGGTRIAVLGVSSVAAVALIARSFGAA